MATLGNSTSVPMTPKTIYGGIADRSQRQRPDELPVNGLHIPICFIYSEKGPEKPFLVSGNSVANIYGDQCLNEQSKYAVHSTAYLKELLAAGNSCVIKRVIPDDVGPKASIRIFIDVLEETQLDEIERTTTGAFKMSGSTPVVKSGSKLAGYKVRFTTEAVPKGEFGNGKSATGLMSSTTSAPSTKYPLMDIEVPFYGAYGNNVGVVIYAPTTGDSIALNPQIFNEDNFFPFRIGFVTRPNDKTTGKFVKTKYEEEFVDFSLNPDTVDSVYGKQYYLEDVATREWFKKGTNIIPESAGPVGDIHLYQENIDKLLHDFLLAEKTHAYPGADLKDKNEDDDKYLFNIFGLSNINGNPYQAVRFDDPYVGTRFNKSIKHYLSGGSDGTFSRDDFETKVGVFMDEMADPNSILQSHVRYPMNFFYDTGFKLNIKEKLSNFIAVRKDTFIVYSTYVDGEKPMTLSEEAARSLLISTMVRTQVENVTIGTHAVRFAIVGSTGEKPSTGRKAKRYSASLELQVLLANLASGTHFNDAAIPDQGNRTRFTRLTNVEPVWRPRAVADEFWKNGVIYPELFTADIAYFPCVRTGYDNDTSVLMSIPFVMACMEAYRVGDEARRNFSGSLGSKDWFVDALTTFVIERLKGRFAGLFKISVDVFFTDADNLRGFSWHLRIRVYGENPKTVEFIDIEALRMEDADGAAFTA